MYETETKSNDQIFAEALSLIIKNQMEIRKHIGIIHNTERWGDCYHDHEIIDELEYIK